MENNSNLVIIKKNPFSKIVKIIENFLKKNKYSKKKHSDEKRKVYIVEYDTNPLNTKYGDIYYGDKIIRNSPYVKEIVNPIKYSKKPYSEEQKDQILKKYQNLKNNKIKVEELELDEIIMINKLMKEEIKIRKDKLN